MNWVRRGVGVRVYAAWMDSLDEAIGRERARLARLDQWATEERTREAAAETALVVAMAEGIERLNSGGSSVLRLVGPCTGWWHRRDRTIAVTTSRGVSYRKVSEQRCWKLQISGDARGSGRTVFLLDDGSVVEVEHETEIESADRNVVAVTRFPDPKKLLPFFGSRSPVYIGDSWDMEEPEVAAVKNAYACIASAMAAYERGER
jgi:hypothetical protein